jgi:hypothetical protein
MRTAPAGELEHGICVSSRTVISDAPPETLEWLGGWSLLLSLHSVPTHKHLTLPMLIGLIGITLACHHRDGGNKDVWNVGKLLPDYT